MLDKNQSAAKAFNCDKDDFLLLMLCLPDATPYTIVPTQVDKIAR